MEKFCPQAIKELRLKHKMSQKALGESLGISNRAISKWESGLSQPSAKNIYILSKLFNVPIDFFYEKSAPAAIEELPGGMSSIAEIYKIGRGPSSSHTIGPETACKRFKEKFADADRFKVVLYGSLAKTGKGHGTDVVIKKTLSPIPCEIEFDLFEGSLPHPNTMLIVAYKNADELGRSRIFSIGGGNILFENELNTPLSFVYPHSQFSEICAYCKENKLRLWEYAEKFEGPQLKEYLEKVWTTMKNAIEEGLDNEGILPGGLDLARKAKTLFNSQHIDESAETREHRMVCAYAFATSEQNASGETIVTAPTCGAAGVVPAVLYYQQKKSSFSDHQIVHALMTAGIIGNLIKTNASISGAECGCQAEIGSACAMASAALAELFELSIEKIEYAAEIAIEHRLGLTCDPICGLVQIPCIERNAVAAMRAINAVSLSSFLWSTRRISLDNVIKTMKETGHDLSSHYKETAEAGLAKIKL